MFFLFPVAKFFGNKNSYGGFFLRSHFILFILLSQVGWVNLEVINGKEKENKLKFAVSARQEKCMQSFSFSQNAWRRLKKNKGAMVGLVYYFSVRSYGNFCLLYFNRFYSKFRQANCRNTGKKTWLYPIIFKRKKNKKNIINRFFKPTALRRGR